MLRVFLHQCGRQGESLLRIIRGLPGGGGDASFDLDFFELDVSALTDVCGE
jgi:hypothetical protein